MGEGKASKCDQLKLLCWRSGLQTKREPQLYMAKLFQGIAVAFFMVLVFSNLGRNYPECEGHDCSTISPDLYSLIGAIYFMCVVQMFTNF